MFCAPWGPGGDAICNERAALFSSPHCRRDLTSSSPETANSSASTDVQSKGAVPSEATLELSENSQGVPAASQHILARKPFGQCKPIYLHLGMPTFLCIYTLGYMWYICNACKYIIVCVCLPLALSIVLSNAIS